ncbi:general secretion pathway protein D [Gammaproteobacteria bacterium]
MGRLRPSRLQPRIALPLTLALSLALSAVPVAITQGAAPSSTPHNTGGVTLNLADADLSAVIATVAEITGKNFIVDPRVKGKVTIVSSRPLDKNAIYQVFLSVLEVHGFAAVPSGEITKIVPDANAKQSAITLSTSEHPGNGDETVTRVIDVKNVQAAQLVPILRPLVAQQGHLAAYPQNNMIILSDRAANVQRMMEILRRIDVPSRNEIEIIPLHHASATEVVRVVTSLAQQEKTKEGAGAGGGGMTLVADERTNTVLLGGDKEDRLRLRAIISHLDTPLENTGGNTVVIYLHYAQAKDLVGVLTGVSKGTDSSSLRRSGSGGSSSGQGAPPPPSSPSSSGGGAFKDVSIEADEATNALVITAPPDQMRTILSVIHQLDIRRAQVLVEAIIAEVSATRANELGVQWAVDGIGSSGKGGIGNGGGPVGIVNFPRSGSGGTGLADVLSGAAAGGDAAAAALGGALGSGLNLIGGNFRGNFRFAALIRALSSDGSTNILSTPNLLTLDNQEAEIVVGTNVPFLTGSYSNSMTGSSLGGYGSSASGSTSTLGSVANSLGLGTSGTSGYVSNPFQTIQRQDVGLTLKVKPQINEGSSVKLEIQQEVSALTTPPQGISTSDVVTSKRSIKTTVLVDDGQMVVLGGLIDDQVQENQNKVPLLGDIPLIGGLFRSSSNNINKRNLMIFLHPVILRDAAVTALVSGSKYNYMRDRQIEAMHPENRPKDPGLVLPPLSQMEGQKMRGMVEADTSTSMVNTASTVQLELPPPFENDEASPTRFFENSPDVRP